MNPFAPKFARSRRALINDEQSTVDSTETGSGESIVDTPEVAKPKAPKAPKPRKSKVLGRAKPKRPRRGGAAVELDNGSDDE